MSDTRDIVIETRTNVANMRQSLDTFIQESREHRAMQSKRLSGLEDRVEKHEALVDRLRGMKWLTVALAGIVGYAGHYLPHPFR